jgi:hypothetical protein
MLPATGVSLRSLHLSSDGGHVHVCEAGIGAPRTAATRFACVKGPQAGQQATPAPARHLLHGLNEA